MRGSKQLHNAAREVEGLSGVTRDNFEMRGVVSEDLGGERVGYSVYVHIKQRNRYTVCERPESQMVGNTFSTKSLPLISLTF